MPTYPDDDCPDDTLADYVGDGDFADDVRHHVAEGFGVSEDDIEVTVLSVEQRPGPPPDPDAFDIRD